MSDGQHLGHCASGRVVHGLVALCARLTQQLAQARHVAVVGNILLALVSFVRITEELVAFGIK